MTAPAPILVAPHPVPGESDDATETPRPGLGGTPSRIQLRCTKGWRKPEGAIVVARPSKWGNPFRITKVFNEWAVNGLFGMTFTAESENEARAVAVGFFVDWCRMNASQRGWDSHEQWRTALQAELHGHDLACWCPLDQPCHADVLLKLANS